MICFGLGYVSELSQKTAANTYSCLRRLESCRCRDFAIVMKD